MKLQVTQENLNKALSAVARVANTRGTLPILSNVLLKTSNNRLSIAATNLDIAITQFVGSKIEEEGAITIPARLMHEFVGSLPEGTLELMLDGNKLHITAEKYKSTINGIVADEFPVMPAITEGKTITLPTADFKKSLQQVVFAASSDDSRPVLTGIYFYNNEGSFTAAATDSYRLAERRIGATDSDGDFLLPASAASDLLRIINDSVKEVVITHDDQQVQFNVGDVTLVARLIEGNYPEYQKLIPSKFSTVAKLSKADFINITKVSSLFARESAGSITVKAAGEEVSINAIASQLGENTATATAEVSGEGEVTLNSRFLIDALGAFSGDDVEFCFNGKLEPCILRSAGDKDYTHLIMPLRS